jgi:hypothetical protein
MIKDMEEKDEVAKYTILEFVRNEDCLESSIFGSLVLKSERSQKKREPLIIQKHTPPTVHQAVRLPFVQNLQQHDPPNDHQTTRFYQRAFGAVKRLLGNIWDCIPQPVSAILKNVSKGIGFVLGFFSAGALFFLSIVSFFYFLKVVRFLDLICFIIGKTV